MGGEGDQDRSPSDIARNVRPDNGKGKTTNKEGEGEIFERNSEAIYQGCGLSRVAGRRKLHLFRALIGAQGSRVKWTLQNDRSASLAGAGKLLKRPVDYRDR